MRFMLLKMANKMQSSTSPLGKQSTQPQQSETYEPVAFTRPQTGEDYKSWVEKLITSLDEKGVFGQRSSPLDEPSTQLSKRDESKLKAEAFKKQGRQK